ncbi:MAG: hypothetical protein AB7F09_27735 [Parvibaculaceae bacterium]
MNLEPFPMTLMRIMALGLSALVMTILDLILLVGARRAEGGAIRRLVPARRLVAQGEGAARPAGRDAEGRMIRLTGGAVARALLIDRGFAPLCT